MERMRPSLSSDQYMTAEQVKASIACPKCGVQKDETCIKPDGTPNGKKRGGQNHMERVRLAVNEKKARR